MEQILEAYSIPDEIIKAIMIMYKNTQTFVRSPDDDTEFLDIIAGDCKEILLNLTFLSSSLIMY